MKPPAFRSSLGSFASAQDRWLRLCSAAALIVMSGTLCMAALILMLRLFGLSCGPWTVGLALRGIGAVAAGWISWIATSGVFVRCGVSNSIALAWGAPAALIGMLCAVIIMWSACFLFGGVAQIVFGVLLAPFAAAILGGAVTVSIARLPIPPLRSRSQKRKY